MPAAAEPHEAIVLRTLRYGEADIIAHLFTRHAGRVNAMAKGARRPKSRLGARLDPFLVTTVMLRAGRGDLAHVQGVEVSAAHDRLRRRYRCQQAAAAALDTLGRLSVEHAANEPAYHLASRLLALLDAENEPDDHHLAALLAGYELKLLHLTGMAPQLVSCVRCGADSPLTRFSAADGGAACTSCSVMADRPLAPAVLDAAVWAMRTSLADVAAAHELPDRPLLRSVRGELTAAMCREHAGFSPRT
jgi:DNA repair protein RecO (recombination protein O)